MLRPVSFSIPSSTELKVIFNKALSKEISKDNFLAQSISGNVDDLSIRKIDINNNYIILTTSPQVAGNFYSLKMLDLDGARFASESGSILVNDDVSRTLFFVGLKNHNPVRDRMFFNVPKTYDLENSNINNIISAQSEEIYKAQKDLGRVLSNNYISVEVKDERRLRSSGATDRLQNEGTYEIVRVSSSPTLDNLVFREVEYTSKSLIPRHAAIPEFPVSLQEVYVSDEEISLSSEDNDFDGFLISLSNDNVIKVTSVTHIKKDEVPDCNGKIGTVYDLDTCKYSISDNKYDPKAAFSNISLGSREVLLSQFGNVDRPIKGDTLIVSYIYKDVSINVNEDSVEAYNIKEQVEESIPSNITRFFLENAPIVDSNNEIPQTGGVSFSSNMIGGGPKAFLKELAFESSKTPSDPGEFSINYATGEVIVAGANYSGEGTGKEAIRASYFYRNVFTNNLDYYLKDGDLVAATSRAMVGSEASIEFNYERIFIEGVDYESLCHKEVYNEHIGNRLASSFSLKPQKTPVTDVYRIYNQTTGEIYNPLYSTDSEIFFSGKRSPEIKRVNNEEARFSLVDLEESTLTGEFICPSFSVKITSNASNSSISFSPGIPSELIDQFSLSYFARSLGLTGGDEVSDIQIRFFGQPNSEGIISTFGISSTATAPSLGEHITIGPRTYRFDLNNGNILSETLDSIGSSINSSINFEDKSLFLREKYFEYEKVPARVAEANSYSMNTIILDDNSNVFYENMSRIRRVGDFSVDYKNGVVYLAVSFDQNYEPIKLSYHHGEINNYNKNVISLTGAFKKLVSSDSAENSNISYNDMSNNSEYSYINDLEDSLEVHKDGTVALNKEGVLSEAFTILPDYTVVSEKNIGSVRGVYNLALLKGRNLSSNQKALRTKDVSSPKAKDLVSNGGANLFDNIKMSFDKNVIDLKIYEEIRARHDESGLIVDIKDSDLDSIYEIRHKKTGKILFDEKLNIEKISNLDVVFCEELEDGTVRVDIRTGVDLSSVDDSDYLLDSRGSRFKIISSDHAISRLVVESPAINNVEAITPEDGSASIIVKASVVGNSNGARIYIPSDSYVQAGDVVSLSYVQKSIPRPGTKVALDCLYGSVYIDYMYLYDDVYIFYEFGDNQIDWSASNSVREGEEYFVTYKYGASRSALRDNFGVLTKIPYFQRFPLEANREVYRSALSGVMSAFSNGAVKTSFETLVRSFTDINPNIEEAVFGNWILGREYINPEQLSVKGPISFRESKFNQGIYVDKDTVISTPSISNINLDEGTFSAWVKPDWAGINNDADITLHLEDFGTTNYAYKSGDNIFDYSSNFDIMFSQDTVGGTDLTGGSIAIHNYTHQWSESEDKELLEIGAFAISNPLSKMDWSIKTDFETSLKVDHFFAPERLNPPRRRPSEDLASSRVNMGLAGLGKSLSDASNGLINSGLEIEFIRFCSPGFISIADKNKIFLSMLTMIPVINPDNGRIFTFRVGNEHIEKNEIPEYEKLFSTSSCRCSFDDTLEDLLRFRDKDFQTLKVVLDYEIDLSHINNLNVVIDSDPSVFKVLDTRGSVYEVYAFIGNDNELYLDSIPDTIKGFHLNRIPENKNYITGLGAKEVNETLPLGELTLLYQAVSLVTNKPSDSKAYLGYEAKPYVINWSTESLRIGVSRDPLNNMVKITLSDEDKNVKYLTDIFYSDLLSVEKESLILEYLNLDKWFNTSNGVNYVDNISSISQGLYLGILDRTCASSLQLNDLSYSIYHRYSKENIYIGSSARNPKKIPFTLNKDDYPDISSGLPYNADSEEGVFIGFDETCESPVSGGQGQWVFRTRTADSVSFPISVIPSEDGGYSFLYSKVPVNNNISGKILSNGEFSSITRSAYDGGFLSCSVDDGCSARFRYCGESPLEVGGWTMLEESNSSLINTIIGGVGGQSAAWSKHGSFSSSVDSGIYRAGESVYNDDSTAYSEGQGNFLYTRLPCYDGNYDVSIDFVVQSEEFSEKEREGLGAFSGIVSGRFSGISPIHIYDDHLNLKLSLARSDYGQPLLVVLDGESSEILDIAYYEWTSLERCHISLEKNIEEGVVTVSSDRLILSKILIEDIEDRTAEICSLLNEPFIAIHLFDESVADSKKFHESGVGNILDISKIEFSGKSIDKKPSLEDNDIFITTDSKIDFNFNNRPLMLEGDGYVDGYYSDGYLDSYIEDSASLDGYDQEEIYNPYDVDEICFTSDRLRFLLDTGLSDSEGRMSIYKDGKGFLNFRIFDTSRRKGGESNIYNIATNIKHFKPGELHHIAASWRLNTIFEKDEMHLFIDGQESPNLFRFGGPVKVKINDKFSDVSKERLQDFVTDNIEYSPVYSDGTILANTSKFISKSAGFNKDMVGRSIIMLDSDLAGTYMGREYIINSVDEDEVTFVSGQNLDIVTFDASAADISFIFAPIAGVKRKIKTDVKNSKFSIYRTSCSDSEEELGGVLYRVENGQISIVSGNDIENPSYRVDVDKKLIEFVGKDGLCKYNKTVEFSDLDVHIKTFGLQFALFNEKVNLSSSSYFNLDKISQDPYSGKSVFLSHAAEPISIKDVSIRRVILDKTIPEVSVDIGHEGNVAEFSVYTDRDDGTAKLSSEPGRIFKQNMGRLLEVRFDSDNTIFCKEEGDGYLDSYSDPTAVSKNVIRVTGKTVDGYDYEDFEIKENGPVRGQKYFLEVSEVSGVINIADPYYEPFVIEVVEADDITIPNNMGEFAEVYRYLNGSFIISAYGSSGTVPFELHPGNYLVRYPAHLKVALPAVGEKLFVGCDMNEENQFGGVVDELRIITEMSSDTRSTQKFTDGTRSITKDFYNPNPLCTDDQTLVLAHFDSPIKEQSRALRGKQFLDKESNFKYRLGKDEVENLLESVNDRSSFESKMVRMGFDKDTAEQTFIEVHRAQGGPIFNEARFGRSDEMIVSSNSVNSNFGASARFFNTPPLFIDNRMSYFRKNSGTIELWVSPLLSTLTDSEERFFVDIYSSVKKKVTSLSPQKIQLPSPAKKIVKIQLLKDTEEFAEFREDSSSLFLDNIVRSKVSGRLSGGPGTSRDFSEGCKISPDGKSVSLNSALPGSEIDVVVTYIPVSSSGDRLSIYKNKNSQLVFSILANGKEHSISKDVDWIRNSWHKITCIYKTNSSSDYMRIFVDGEETSSINYGEEGLLYGSGALYGQEEDKSSQDKHIKIELGDDFKVIALGADIFGEKSSLSRIDNVRFSRVARPYPTLPSGNAIDVSYSNNLESVLPVKQDDLTTILINFQKNNGEDSYVTLVDPYSGIFDFDIEVLDYFGKINDEVIEDLIIQLVNRLKPAHTNARVVFPRESC